MEQTQQKNKMLYIVMLLLVIMILIVLRSLIISDTKTIIDYDISALELFNRGEYVVDREVYYIVDSILNKMIVHYTTNGENIEEYYEVLDKGYKKKINKSEFIVLMNKLFDSITLVDNDLYGEYKTFQQDNIIRVVKKIESDSYMCSIGLNEGNKVCFLGLTLDKDKNTYEIFYIGS